MRQAGMEMGKAVAFFIIAGGAVVVMAILLATPLQVDLLCEPSVFSSCREEMSDRAPGIIGAGVVAIIALGFGAVYVASSYQLAERARPEET